VPFSRPPLALLPLLCALPLLAAEPTIERVAAQADFTMQGSITDLSGLVWTGGDSFFAVSDKRSAVLPVTLQIDLATGAITHGEFGPPIPVPATQMDFEGIAYVTAERRFFISTETPAGVISFRAGEREVRALPLPAPYSRTRHGLALEALTWNDQARQFWIANEEALEGDGPVTSATAGTVVRLAKFDAAFRPLAQYAWRTETAALRIGAGCGVADLLLLPDGTLLVLERGFVGFGLAVRLFAADFAGATDVTKLPALEGATFTPARKTLLFAEGTGMRNYEGLALGPPLADGTRSLILVADSHGGTEHCFLPLKLRLPGPARK